jgi:hypothetical protein
MSFSVLAFVDIPVDITGFQKFGVRRVSSHFPVVQNQNPVGIHNGIRSLADENDGHGPVHRADVLSKKSVGSIVESA